MKSQEERILAWLKSGKSITPIQALVRFGSLRLGARIYELKSKGHAIKTRMILTPTGKYIAQYFYVREHAKTAKF